jgi:uncharacterized coiled-coil DUF342 family protein
MKMKNSDKEFAGLPIEVRNAIEDQNLIDALEEYGERKDAEIEELKKALEIYNGRCQRLQEERDELHEALIEIDPNYAEVASASDRGHEMRSE